MAWDITVAGTLHLDDITTPWGRRQRQLGGSALYFSLAAAPLARVHLQGIVGQDAEPDVRATLDGLDVDLGGLTVSAVPTFRWHAVHDFDRWVADTVGEEPGCEPDWRPRLSPDAAAAPVLFLGSMAPARQAEVLDQSRARLIGVDSMACYTGPERDAVLEVVERCDVLFLNRVELGSLVPEASGWREAAVRLLGRGRLRALVVKAGPAGAALVTRSDGTAVAPAVLELPAAEVARVVDPTGAGDAVAGGYLGVCAAAERDDAGCFPDALQEGLRAAAAAISSFGAAALRAAAMSRAGSHAIPAASLPSRERKAGGVQ
jgi:sugar/nucleoside kinase (ribokinase family)